jgi:hypothetical protein
MCDVTLRRVLATIVAVEKQRVLHNLYVCFCNLRYPACNAHAPYCHLWPARLYNIFHITSQKHDFRKKLLKTKHVFWYPLQIFSETYLTLRRTERGMVKIYIGLHVKYRLFLSDFNEPWVFSTNFRKIFKYQISWKSVHWEPVCFIGMDERTDEQMVREIWRSQ